MKYLSMIKTQRGEISLTLSLLGIFIALIGVGLGVVSVQQQVTTSTSAQLLPGDYPYSTKLEIRDVNGNVIAWEDGITWTNFIQGGTNPGATNGDIKDVSCSGNCPAQLVWNTGSVPQSLRDTTAGVQIRLPDGYQIVDTFCQSGPRDMCENITVNQDGPRLVNFQNMKIQKDTQVYYGVVVQGGTPYTGPSQPEPTNPPGENPPPPGTTGNMEVQVVALNYPQVTRFWDSDHSASRRPASCTRQGPSEEQRPLYISEFTIRAECTGGGCQVGQRHEVEVEKNKGYANLYNLPVGEYKLDIKDVNDRGFREYEGCEDRRWTVTANQTTQEPVMMLSNFEDGDYETTGSESNCKQEGGKPNLIQGIGGNLCYYPNGRTGGGGGGGDEPSDPGSLQCSQLCIYSEGTPENFKCYEGVCPADRPDCGGNTPKERIDNGNKGCTYGLDSCGVQAYEVSCTTGERVGTDEPPNDPAPPVINPTIPPIDRSTAAMAFQPGSFDHPSVKVGDTIDVDLYLNTAEKVYRTIALVGFNSDLVEVVDAYASTPGTQVLRGNLPDISARKGKQISNTTSVNRDKGTGVISYGVERFAPFGGQAGLDVVYRVTFKAKKAGKVDLTFKGRTVMNEQREQMNIQTFNGWFTVVEGDVEVEKSLTFAPLQTSIVKGQDTSLVWRANGASRVLLDGVRVQNEGRQKISPTTDTTYTMRATWPDTTVKEKKVTIQVADSSRGTPEPPENIKDGKLSDIKVLVMVYNPRIMSKNEPVLDYFIEKNSGRTLDQYLKTEIARALREHNSAIPAYNYQVVDQIERTADVPIIQRGLYNTPRFERFLEECSSGNNGSCEKAKDIHDIDYGVIAKEHNLCERANKGEFDEIWNVALPGYDFGENDMIGPRPFGINGKTFTVPECKTNIPTAVFNPFAGGPTTHIFFHRIEATMNQVYGDYIGYGDHKGDPSILRTPWNKYTRFAKAIDKERNEELLGYNAPHGCGNAHFTPLSTKEYDYDNASDTDKETKTYCESYGEYPDFDISEQTSITCEIWGCSELGYDIWAFRSFPANKGRDASGKLNNWWRYIHDPETALEDFANASLYFSDNSGDNKVDAIDVSNTLSNLGLSSTEASNAYTDVNQDGFINGLDIQLLFDNYYEEIPEPEIIKHPNGYDGKQ